MAGDEPSAKQAVAGLLGQLGWGPDQVVDLGGLTAARGLEAFVLLWWSMTQSFGTFDVNVEVRTA
ncbi:MAG: oxidoreductase [Pseudonocardia sp.]|jgi:predicted dinucleotide-binding enzyme|nr:oxidoreductase [Pseudonocardia sp.]